MSTLPLEEEERGGRRREGEEGGGRGRKEGEAGGRERRERKEGGKRREGEEGGGKKVPQLFHTDSFSMGVPSPLPPSWLLESCCLDLCSC